MKQLLLRLQSDDQTVINDLRKNLYKPCRHNTERAGLHSDEDFQEIFDDALMVVWKQRHTYIDDAHIESSLAGILRNKAISLLRAKKTNKHMNTRELEEIDIPVWSENKFDFGLTFDIIGAMYKAFDELPAQCKQVMDMHYRKRLTVNEIAAQLNIKQPNVSKQLGIGQQKLLTAMKKVDPDLDPAIILQYLPNLDFPE